MAGIDEYSQASLPGYAQAPWLPAMASALHAADSTRWRRWRLLVTHTVASLLAAHRADTATLVETIKTAFRRIREVDDPAIFICLDRKSVV